MRKSNFKEENDELAMILLLSKHLRDTYYEPGTVLTTF